MYDMHACVSVCVCVLHCNDIGQKDDLETAHEQLPEHLADMERLPLVCCPEVSIVLE